MRGSPGLSDRRSRRELHESASPIAFAEHAQSTKKQSLYQTAVGRVGRAVSPCKSLFLRRLTVLSSELPEVRGESVTSSKAIHSDSLTNCSDIRKAPDSTCKCLQAVIRNCAPDSETLIAA